MVWSNGLTNSSDLETRNVWIEDTFSQRQAALFLALSKYIWAHQLGEIRALSLFKIDGFVLRTQNVNLRKVGQPE